MRRLELLELIKDGRIAVRFLETIAGRFAGNERFADTVADCRRLAVTFETMVKALEDVAKESNDDGNG